MNNIKQWVISLLFFSSVFSSFNCLAAAKMDRIFLYLPDQAMNERVVSQQQFIEYVGAVKEQLFKNLTPAAKKQNFSFSLIVAIRSKSESKVWFKFIEGDLEQAIKLQLINSIESIPVPEGINGVVPFALAVHTPSSVKRFDTPPIHDSWIASGKAGEISELINDAWNQSLL